MIQLLAPKTKKDIIDIIDKGSFVKNYVELFRHLYYQDNDKYDPWNIDKNREKKTFEALDKFLGSTTSILFMERREYSVKVMYNGKMYLASFPLDEGIHFGHEDGKAPPLRFGGVLINNMSAAQILNLP